MPRRANHCMGLPTYPPAWLTRPPRRPGGAAWPSRTRKTRKTTAACWFAWVAGGLGEGCAT
eukprot:392112-Alexandrium_andersonii.AAC.1